MTPSAAYGPADVRARSELRVAFGGAVYPAEEVARGAAFALHSAAPGPGFQPTRTGAGWHRFVHASDVAVVQGSAGEPADNPLWAPLSRARGWADVHRMCQRPEPAEAAVVAGIRRTVTVRRGTRMVKALSAHQLAGYLRGWLPAGFCHREYDVAHLRTPEDLRLLRTDPDTAADSPDVAFALRWRAVDGRDYEIPDRHRHPGLPAMPAHERLGPPVLGTGFTPSAQHLIPEYVTADLADLPLPANAALLAYTPHGEEVTLYSYHPEQRGWLRMAGPRWQHLLRGLPDINPDQEYVPVPAGAATVGSRLVGLFRGVEHDAVADPPDEFRVVAMSRAARHPVEALARRTGFVLWRETRCTVVREEGAWLRVRLSDPEPDAVARLGARCCERGVYEAWAPQAEVTAREARDFPYPL
ncbi:MAG TPA: hypothetical protein VNV66_17255 [Pilimelia sp.]|nr:hypothetical protein [Pilimelia sp.]